MINRKTMDYILIIVGASLIISLIFPFPPFSFIFSWIWYGFSALTHALQLSDQLSFALVFVICLLSPVFLLSYVIKKTTPPTEDIKKLEAKMDDLDKGRFQKYGVQSEKEIDKLIWDTEEEYHRKTSKTDPWARRNFELNVLLAMLGFVVVLFILPLALGRNPDGGIFSESLLYFTLGAFYILTGARDWYSLRKKISPVKK